MGCKKPGALVVLKPRKKIKKFVNYCFSSKNNISTDVYNSVDIFKKRNHAK